jgi:hypothetical protein
MVQAVGQGEVHDSSGMTQRHVECADAALASVVGCSANMDEVKEILKNRGAFGSLSDEEQHQENGHLPCAIMCST